MPIFSHRGGIGSPAGIIHTADAQKRETANESQNPNRPAAEN